MHDIGESRMHRHEEASHDVLSLSAPDVWSVFSRALWSLSILRCRSSWLSSIHGRNSSIMASYKPDAFALALGFIAGLLSLAVGFNDRARFGRDHSGRDSNEHASRIR